MFAERSVTKVIVDIDQARGHRAATKIDGLYRACWSLMLFLSE